MVCFSHLPALLSLLQSLGFVMLIGLQTLMTEGVHLEHAYFWVLILCLGGQEKKTLVARSSA